MDQRCRFATNVEERPDLATIEPSPAGLSSVRSLPIHFLPLKV